MHAQHVGMEPEHTPGLLSLDHSSVQGVLARCGPLELLAVRSTCRALQQIADALRTRVHLGPLFSDAQLARLPSRFDGATSLRLDSVDTAGCRRIAEVGALAPPAHAHVCAAHARADAVACPQALACGDEPWQSITSVQGCPADACTLGLLLSALPRLSSVSLQHRRMTAARPAVPDGGGVWRWLSSFVWPPVDPSLDQPCPGPDEAPSSAPERQQGGSADQGMQGCVQALCRACPGLQELGAPGMDHWLLDAATWGLLGALPRLSRFNSPACPLPLAECGGCELPGWLQPAASGGDCGSSSATPSSKSFPALTGWWNGLRSLYNLALFMRRRLPGRGGGGWTSSDARITSQACPMPWSSCTRPPDPCRAAPPRPFSRPAVRAAGLPDPALVPRPLARQLDNSSARAGLAPAWPADQPAGGCPDCPCSTPASATCFGATPSC